MDYKGLKETLEEFISRGCVQYPVLLDNLISDTARTGIVRLPWKLLKPLLLYRLQKVLNNTYTGVYTTDDEDMPGQLKDRLTKFENPPFTIQRICELIVEPQKQYKKRDKYMRAMEKCLMVVSTQEPDLTWMKSPRLTQLLEEPPRQPLSNISTHRDYNSQDEEEMNTEQPSSQSDLNSSAEMDLDILSNTSGGSGADLNLNASPESSTHTECVVEDSNKGKDDSISCRPRKRTSSIRDSMDDSSNSETDIEMSPVLQEADSTTTVGIEQDHIPVKFERQNSLPHTHAATGDGDKEEELENSVFKRMKPSSPTPVMVGSNVTELETKLSTNKIIPPETSSEHHQQHQQQQEGVEKEIVESLDSSGCKQ